MSDLWINIRIGVRHLQIGRRWFSFHVNPYHLRNKPKTWFEVHQFFN